MTFTDYNRFNLRHPAPYPADNVWATFATYAEFNEANGEVVPAIQIWTDDEGYDEPLTTVTVNLAEYDIYPELGHVLVKDYSENEGLGQALVDLGFLEGPTRGVKLSPFDVLVNEFKLLEPWAENVKRALAERNPAAAEI